MTNPKDLIGAKKAPLDGVPTAGAIFSAPAHANGHERHGYYNWREQPVQAMTYIGAIQRHLAAWVDGQDLAEDSGIHHLAHALAGLNILADAMGMGNLIDNRPPKGPAADMLRAQDKSAPFTLTCALPRCFRLPAHAPHAVDSPAVWDEVHIWKFGGPELDALSDLILGHPMTDVMKWKAEYDARHADDWKKPDAIPRGYCAAACGHLVSVHVERQGGAWCEPCMDSVTDGDPRQVGPCW